MSGSAHVTQISLSHVHIQTGHCTARQCSPLRQKIMKCSINNPTLSLLMKHLVIGQRLKTPLFSAFHWSPCGSLISIGQHFVATRVVHLPKSTETSLITESDQSGPNHKLLQLYMARTSWSDSDQAVRAVHSCNSWFEALLAICYVPLKNVDGTCSWRFGLAVHPFVSRSCFK